MQNIVCVASDSHNQKNKSDSCQTNFYCFLCVSTNLSTASPDSDKQNEMCEKVKVRCDAIEKGVNVCAIACIYWLISLSPFSEFNTTTIRFTIFANWNSHIVNFSILPVHTAHEVRGSGSRFRYCSDVGISAFALKIIHFVFGNNNQQHKERKWKRFWARTRMYQKISMWQLLIAALFSIIIYLLLSSIEFGWIELKSGPDLDLRIQQVGNFIVSRFNSVKLSLRWTLFLPLLVSLPLFLLLSSFVCVCRIVILHHLGYLDALRKTQWHHCLLLFVSNSFVSVFVVHWAKCVARFFSSFFAQRWSVAMTTVVCSAMHWPQVWSSGHRNIDTRDGFGLLRCTWLSLAQNDTGTHACDEQWFRTNGQMNRSIWFGRRIDTNQAENKLPNSFRYLFESLIPTRVRNKQKSPEKTISKILPIA